MHALYIILFFDRFPFSRFTIFLLVSYILIKELIKWVCVSWLPIPPTYLVPPLFVIPLLYGTIQYVYCIWPHVSCLKKPFMILTFIILVLVLHVIIDYDILSASPNFKIFVTALPTVVLFTFYCPVCFFEPDTQQANFTNSMLDTFIYLMVFYIVFSTPIIDCELEPLLLNRLVCASFLSYSASLFYMFYQTSIYNDNLRLYSTIMKLIIGTSTPASWAGIFYTRAGFYEDSELAPLYSNYLLTPESWLFFVFAYIIVLGLKIILHEWFRPRPGCRNVMNRLGNTRKLLFFVLQVLVWFSPMCWMCILWYIPDDEFINRTVLSCWFLVFFIPNVLYSGPGFRPILLYFIVGYACFSLVLGQITPFMPACIFFYVFLLNLLAYFAAEGRTSAPTPPSDWVINWFSTWGNFTIFLALVLLIMAYTIL
jgi:hypothetical protein